MKTSIYVLILTICCVFPAYGQVEIKSQPLVKTNPTQKSISSSLDSTDWIELLLVGNGDIQKAISGGNQFEANTGVGVVFRRHKTELKTIQDIEFECNINVFSTADSLIALFDGEKLINRRRFGSYLLAPKSSKQAADAKFSLYFGNYDKNFWVNYISGIHIELLASNTVWSTNDKSVNVAAFAAKYGIFHDFIPDNVRKDNNYSIRVGVNYIYRKIRGDIAASEYEDLRSKILGSKDIFYQGVEMSMLFRLNNITAELQIPLLSSGSHSVPGLTGTQMITSISFTGGVPLDVLKKKPSTE